MAATCMLASHHSLLCISFQCTQHAQQQHTDLEFTQMQPAHAHLDNLVLVQVVLRNGLRVFLVQDPDVPLVKGMLLFRGGLRASPPDKVSC